LGEELLIIQKEFSGFSDTNERLDLLTIDYKGNLVIIENKLDDSGKDVADITISLDKKAHDEVATGAEIVERELIRDRFWKELLPRMNAKSQLFSGINIDGNHYDHWLTTGAGMSGLGYSFVITKKYAAVELALNRADKSNKLEKK